MTAFGSNEAFFQAVNDLLARLERKGHEGTAASLRDGLGCLNGLTDGWALFLEAIDGVLASASGNFEQADRQALEAIRAAAHTAVHRR